MPTQTDTQSQVARKLNFAIQGAALQTAVCSLNSNGNVTHVVTVGGLAAALAASAYGNQRPQAKPFLSLVGGHQAISQGQLRHRVFKGV